MNNLPTIKQLRYFIALDKYGHFGKAADTCYVTQPAFSVAIRELESTLGIQLVDRTNKSVTITRIGKDIASQARLVISDMENLAELAKLNQQPLCGQISIGVIPTIAPFLLPGLLPKLRKAYPQLKLILQEDQTQRIYQQLMAGELDIILVAIPFELRNTHVLKLFNDNFFLACRDKSKLFNPETQSIEQLPEGSILLLEDGHCMRDHALAACKIRNIDKVSPITANSLLTLVQMVDSDLGVTYLPEMAINSLLLKNTRVKTWPLRQGRYRTIGLAWRNGSVRSSEFNLLGEFIKAHWMAGNH